MNAEDRGKLREQANVFIDGVSTAFMLGQDETARKRLGAFKTLVEELKKTVGPNGVGSVEEILKHVNSVIAGETKWDADEVRGLLDAALSKPQPV